MEATCVLASASVNRFSSCSALIRSTLATDRQSDEGRVQDFEACMAFGAGKNLGIWWCEDPKEYRQITILKGHEASVTVVKSLYTPSGLTSPRSYLFGGFSFMSGDTKGGVRIWRGSQRDYGPLSVRCRRGTSMSLGTKLIRTHFHHRLPIIPSSRPWFTAGLEFIVFDQE